MTMGVVLVPWVFVLLVPMIQWRQQRVDLDHSAGVVHFDGVATSRYVVLVHPCRAVSVPVSDVLWVNDTRPLGPRLLEVNTSQGVIYICTDKSLELADCARELKAISRQPTYSEDRVRRAENLRFHLFFWRSVGIPIAFGAAYGVYRLLIWLF